jgi:phosphoglycolate phosphatase-like HAD superfamily hydrolase
VRRQAAAGYDFIKIYVNLDSASYYAVLDEAASAGLDVAGHAPRALGLRGVLEAPLHSLEHLTDFAVSVEADDSPFRGRFHWAKLYLGMPADTAQMAAVAQRVAASRMWVVPTLVERERSVADSATVAQWTAEPHLSLLPDRIVERWRNDNASVIGRMDGDDWRLIAAGVAHQRALLRALAAAGVPLLIGSDTPNRFVVPGLSVHEELAAFVGAGLTAEAALAAATREAARFLRQQDQWGTVEVGRRADLLLLAANPLDDLSAVRRPLGVVLRGRWLPAERLAELSSGLR